MDDFEVCPRCSTSKKNKPSMKLMINVCAHSLCETCVEQLFFRGSGSCPKCSRMLKKSDFRDQIFEDTYVEKEILIRKKIIKDLNRNEDEFPNLRDFNDYLETVETLIFNLTNNVDEEDSLKKLDELKKEAKEKAKSRSRMMMESSSKRENQTYTYKPLTFYFHGPSMASDADLLQRYVGQMSSGPAQLASGFPPFVPVRRLLEDAFSDLYYSVRAFPA